MTFSSVRSKQKEFDNTFYKKMPFWVSTRRKRTMWVLFSVLVPVLFVTYAFFHQPADSFVALLLYLTAVLFPLLFFAPILIIMFKNDCNAAMRPVVGRYEDKLLLDANKWVYTYMNRRETRNYRHEVVIPYDRISRIVLFTKMNLVAIKAGGIFTTYENNRVQERTEFAGPFANELTRVDIPLVYQDNDLFLQQLQQATGRSIMRNDTDNPDAL